MKFLNAINLKKNELQNAVIQNLATAPESPKAGQIYFDTGSNDLRIYSNGTWVSALAPGTSINTRTGAIQLTGGNAITIVENPNGTFTFNHDGITNDNLTAQSRRYVTGLTFDAYGHITGYETGTETVVNTDTITRLQGDTLGSLVSGDITIAGGDNVTISQGGTGNRTLTIASTYVDTTYTGGNLVTIDDTTVNHDNLSSAYSTSADNGTTLTSIEFLNSLTVDAAGHTSAAKFRKLVAGSNVTITPTSNGNVSIASSFTNTTYTGGTYLTLNGTTFNHDDTTRTDTTSNSSPDFAATFNVIDGVTTNDTGHVTAVNVKTVTVPSETTLSLGEQGGTGNVVTGIAVSGHEITVTKGIDALTSHQSIKVLNTDNSAAQSVNSTETIAGTGTISLHKISKTGAYSDLIGVTTLSKVDNGTGTWLTGVDVSDHQITLTRSNATTDTITVGELIVSSTGAGNGNVTIAGDLTVNGTTTSINTETVEIEDNLILINKVDSSQEPYTPPTSLVGGLQVYRGTETDYKLVFVEEFEDFRIGQVGDLQPVLTRDESDNFDDNDLLTWDDTNHRAVGSKPADLGIPRKFAVTQAISTNGTYTITHNLGTTDVTVSLKDNATNEFLYADVETTGVNTIEVSFGEINSTVNVRVIVIG